MPIYEYKGQQYDVATDDVAAAKSKILGYLEKQSAPAEEKPAPAAEKPAPVERKLGLSSALAKDDSFSSMLSRDNSGIRAPITAEDYLKIKKEKEQSVLEKTPLPPIASTEDKLLNPQFVSAVEAHLNAMPAEERAGALAKLAESPTVYGRAAKVVAGRYEALDKNVSPTLSKFDPRLEAQKQRFMEQGRSEEDATRDAMGQSTGNLKRDYQQMTRDVVGEKAGFYAAERAKELENADFLDRVGAGVRSQYTKSGLGLLSAYADLTGDKQFSKDLMGARRIEDAREGAIPQGKSIFEKSAQGAMTSLASQAPFIAMTAMTGGSAPLLAQAAIQQFGDSYSEGRSAGLSGQAAATRAVAMATAEVFFERFGMTKALAGLKAHIAKYGVDSVPKYLARAIATEIPPELATTATQYLTDMAPKIGLNKNPSLADFYKQMEETVRQTVLQAGVTAGGTVALTKGAQKAGEALSKIGAPREGAYQRDSSYEGLSELIARQKGFLAPQDQQQRQRQQEEQQQEQAAPPDTSLGELGEVRPSTDLQQPAPLAVTPEAREATIAQLATEIAETQGVPDEDARRMAEARITAQEQQQKRDTAKLATKPQADRIASRAQELLSEGYAQTAQEALETAKTQIQDEDEADALAENEAKGEANVGQPNAASSGAGAQVVGGANQKPTATGVGGGKRSGVVSAQQNAAGANGREAPKPATVKPLPVAQPGEAAMPVQDGERKPVPMSALTTPEALERVRTVLSTDRPIEDLQVAARRGGLATWEINAILGNHGMPNQMNVQMETGERYGPPIPVSTSAPAPVAGKRGPKGPRLAAEEKEKKAVEKKATDALIGRARRALTSITKLFEELPKQLAEGKTNEAAARAKITTEVTKLLKNQQELRDAGLAGSAEGKRIKKFLEANAREVSAVQANLAAQEESLTAQESGEEETGASSTINKEPADERISKFTTGAQALTHVIKTGTPFQARLAKRLRSAVQGVKFVVLEKGQEVPEQLKTPRNAKAWDRSIALYIENYKTNDRVIYVRGASFGNSQGINNTTILHELLHAATNRKLAIAFEYIKKGIYLNTPAVRAAQDLIRIMNSAARTYEDLAKQKKLSMDMVALRYDGDIFNDPREFVSYGLTDPQMQNFLMQAHGYEADTPFFTRFISALRDLLGMKDTDTNALTDLIVVTDNILKANVPGVQINGQSVSSMFGFGKDKDTEAGSTFSISGETVSAKPSANVQRLAKMLGTKLYGTPEDITTVSVKELFQNSFDAIKEAIENGQVKNGKVAIKLDKDKRTINITDNGLGMPTSVMGNQFLQIAGTVKGTSRASGGLGVAKMLFLFENKKLEVVSLRDGKLSRLITTGDELKAAMAANPATLLEQLKDFLSPEDIQIIAPAIQAAITRMRENGEVVPEIKIETSSDPKEIEKYKDIFPDGHGTSVTVQIPETYIDSSSGDEKDIKFPISAHYYPVLGKSPLFDDIEVTFDRGYGPDKLSLGKNFPIDDFTPFANVNFAWGTARVYVSKKIERNYGDNTHVLSNGLWQFDRTISDRPGFGGKAIQRDFYIDVSPSPDVKPEDAGYPFELNRQGFSKQANSDFEKIFNYITAIYSQLDLAAGIKNFGTVQYVNLDGSLTTAEILEPKTPVSDNAFTLIKPGDSVEVREGILYVNNRKLPELTADDLKNTAVRIDELTIPQKDINPKKVMIHDNTRFDIDDKVLTQQGWDVVVIDNAWVAVKDGKKYTEPGTMEELVAQMEADGAIKTESLSDRAREKFGTRYDKYLAEIGQTFQLLRGALVAGGRGEYGDLASQAIGTSIDNEYYGVSIMVPFKGMFINPTTTDMRGSPEEIAISMIGTMIHELAHFKARNHGAEFASEMQRVMTLLKVYPAIDLDQVEKNLTKHIAKNKDIFDFLDKEFRSGNLKPRGNRFKDAGGYQQIKNEGSTESVEGTSGAREGWRPSLSQIAGPSDQNAGQVGIGEGLDNEAQEVGEAVRSQKAIEREAQVVGEKFNESVKGYEFGKAATALQMAQDPRKVIPALAALWKRANAAQRRALVAAPTTEFLADWAGNNVPQLKTVSNLLQRMNGMTLQLLKSAGELTNEIERAFRADKTLRAKLDKIAFMSTLMEIDPSNPNAKERSLNLDKMYAELGTDGQRVYKRIKNHFEVLSEYMSRLLDDQITNSKLPIAEQANLMKKIRAIYETGSKISPYFPLVREGDYWLSIGSGKTRKFFMYETEAQRDEAMQQFADERVKKKPNETTEEFEKRRAENLEELIGDQEYNFGNDISTLRRASGNTSVLLRDIFVTIDGASLGDSEAKERLKDAVYQVYLQSMPEQSFRRQFIHRKGTTGFRPDLLRNVAHTSTKMATQLARIKYAPLLRNALSAAQDSIANRPSMQPFVTEMRGRVDSSLSPVKEGVAASIVGGITKASYIYYLGGASSALLQPLSIFQTGLPVLSRYGAFNATRELGTMLKVWQQYGAYKTNKDGTKSWVAPSIEHAKDLTPLERKAIREMLARDVTTSTYASAVFDYKKTPTENLSSPITNFGKGTVDLLVLGGLMHSTERLSREIMFMSSFRLNIKEGKSFEEAVDQATYDTNEALGNYGEYNRPTFMKGLGGKLLTQFMMYPLHVTLFLLKNFKEMIKPMDGRTRVEAVQKFFGTLGTTYILGGYVALPMFSTIMGLLGWAWEALKDKDWPEDLRSMSFEFWFRTVWMPKQLGETEIGGVKLSAILERGPVNALTGLDISGRTSLNNLWLRDTKEAKTIKEEVMNMMLEKSGAGVNMMVSIAEGLSALAHGDTAKGVKKLLPAGFRNFVTANEYWKEGAKDNKGTRILSKDAFTTGQIIGQAVGFRSDLLANTQYVNFKAIGIQQRILNERQALLNNLDREFRNKNMAKFGTYMKDMNEFNRKFPTYQISGDNLSDALEGNAEKRAKALRGFELNEKNMPLLGTALAPSRKAARTAEAKGRVENTREVSGRLERQ
jgi:hypothetical protein